MMLQTGVLTLWLTAGVVLTATPGEILLNPGFETMDHWDCSTPTTMSCTLTDDSHSGKAVVVANRQANWNSPTQYVNLTRGLTYRVSAWMKLLQDNDKQVLEVIMDIADTDGHHVYLPAAQHSQATVAQGWVHVSGGFTAPDKPLQSARIYFQSEPSVQAKYAVDDVSLTEMAGSGHATKEDFNRVINQIRKSDMVFNVTAAQNIMVRDVRIHVLQTKKSYPFGTAVDVGKYIDNRTDANLRYRQFIHDHFNWIVPENALKWYSIQPSPDNFHWNGPMIMIEMAHQHGIQVRGHNLLWSVENYVQGWVRGLSGQALRDAVTKHVLDVFNHTRGLVEHWDVNNEMLHGQWYQDRLNDPNFNLDFFRFVHQTDPNLKLFLNDYNVVANAYSTSDYIAQAEQYKAANVGLYGLGAQCHFASDNPPDPAAIKGRLDMFAELNLPVWATELDCIAQDENKRADEYEDALRTLYGHPIVEGIMLWGFWDRAHWKGEAAALARGDHLELTAAGRRVLDLLENQWMTDETHSIPQRGGTFTVRGFHGDYEIKIMYLGQELTNLTQTFTLEKDQIKHVNIFVHE